MLRLVFSILISFSSITAIAEQVDVQCLPLDRTNVNKAELTGILNLEDENQIYLVISLSYQLKGHDSEPVAYGPVIAHHGKFNRSRDHSLYSFSEVTILGEDIQRIEILLPQEGEKLPTSFRSRLFMRLNEGGPAHEFQTLCEIKELPR